MARLFPYRFKEDYSSSTCVYKIWFGSKYFIWKGMALKQSIAQVMKDLDRKVRNGTKEDDYFFNTVQYIRKGRILSCTVEVLLETEDHGKLIDFENSLLKQKDSQCLNSNSEAYLPKWINLTKKFVEMTQNKAVGATISESEVQIHQKEGDLKTEPEKKAPDEKIPTPVFRKKEPGQKNTASDMEALLSKLNG